MQEMQKMCFFLFSICLKRSGDTFSDGGSLAETIVRIQYSAE